MVLLTAVPRCLNADFAHQRNGESRLHFEKGGNLSPIPVRKRRRVQAKVSTRIGCAFLVECSITLPDLLQRPPMAPEI